jgi:hypothetical protein
MHLGALLQQRDRLLAVGAVVVDQGDLLALELVETAFLLGDVLYQHVGAHPVGSDQREIPAEDGTILRLAAAVAGGNQGDLVDGRLLRQGEGDAGGQRLHHGGTAMLALQALVALDTAVGGVAGFAFFENDLDAIDAAARISQLQVVNIAVGPWRAVGRIGASAVSQHGEELLLGRIRCRCGQGSGQTDRCKRSGNCKFA